MRPASVTQLLERARSGDQAALAKVYEALYRELQKIARAQLNRHRAQTLDTVGLINESYMKLIGDEGIDATGRAHLLALSARAMRQILIDRHRRRSAEKRGGPEAPVELHEESVAGSQRGGDLLALDEALERLQEQNERLARVVECKFFGGMSYDEIGASLEVSARTARLDWQKAKAWLSVELQARS